jgi:prepilin-type N-terminal cleavage/methylation domain-containing protein
MRVFPTNPLKKSRAPTRDASNYGGFSLVEMLVVMVILLILIGIAAPAFVKTSARARQATRELVKGHLMRARSNAIATGQSTAVIFPDYTAGNDIGGKMLGIAEVTSVADPANAGKMTYNVSKVLQRWEKIPGAVMILNQSSTGYANATIMEQATKISASITGRNVTGSFIVFAPNGQIVFPANQTIEVVLGLGSNAGGTVKASEKIDNNISYDLLQINRLSGKARLIEQ